MSEKRKGGIFLETIENNESVNKSNQELAENPAYFGLWTRKNLIPERRPKSPTNVETEWDEDPHTPMPGTPMKIPSIKRGEMREIYVGWKEGEMEQRPPKTRY